MILNHVLENSSSRNAPDDQGSTKKFTNNCQSKLPGEGTARKITPETMDCSVPRRLRLGRLLLYLNRDVQKWLDFFTWAWQVLKWVWPQFQYARIAKSFHKRAVTKCTHDLFHQVWQSAFYSAPWFLKIKVLRN